MRTIEHKISGEKGKMLTHGEKTARILRPCGAKRGKKDIGTTRGSEGRPITRHEGKIYRDVKGRWREGGKVSAGPGEGPSSCLYPWGGNDTIED